jgi:UTP--glucose-1-phosphate uridylyltransferase
MKVTTAVIWAGGYGSRMLPVTAGISKVMLPVLDKPVVDYVVSDCVKAGISNFIFITVPGSHDLQDYFLGNSGLDDHLRKFNKTAKLAELEHIRAQAHYQFIEQPAGNYGTAVPLQVAAKLLPQDEAFVVSEGDTFFWRESGSDIADMVHQFEESGADGAILTLEQPEEVLHKYGVLDVETRGSYRYLKRLVEKPAPGTAPSNLANVSRYVLTPKLMKYVMDVKRNERIGEFLMTDAIENAAAENDIVVQTVKGTWLDCGTVESWLKANFIMARTRPELAASLKTTIDQLLVAGQATDKA